MLKLVKKDELQDELEDEPFIQKKEETLSLKKKEQIKFIDRVMKHCKAYIAPKTIDEYVQFKKKGNGLFEIKDNSSNEDSLEEV